LTFTRETLEQLCKLACVSRHRAGLKSAAAHPCAALNPVKILVGLVTSQKMGSLKKGELAGH